MALGLILHSIGIITVMIAIGVGLAKTFHFNADTREVFISLIVNVGMPCIILSAIFQIEIDESVIRKIFLVFLFSIVFNVLGIGIGYLFAVVFHKKVNRAKELAILSGLGNTGFIGIPLCAVLLGPEGALYAAIFDAGVDFTIWTVGALLLQKNPRIGFGMVRTMINPPLIAIVVGMIMVLVGYHPPFFMRDLFDRLAAIAAPLAMFYIGIMTISLIQSSSASFRNSRSTIWLPVTVKLVLMPVFAVLIGKALSLDEILLQTFLIQAAMPTLTLSSILFAKFSADEEIGIVTTIISTIAALFTIPVMVTLLNLYLLR